MNKDLWKFAWTKLWFYYNDRMEMLKRGTFTGMIVMQMLYGLLFLSVTGLLSAVLLLIPFLYPPLTGLCLLYALWLWFDWDTPSTGGRPLKYCYLQRCRIFNVVQKYYPISLVKTADLDPEKTYIFGYHPHGMVPEGAVVGFSSESAGFTKLFPGIYPRLAMASFFKWFSVFREIVLAVGIISVSRDSLEYVLTRKGPGHSVVIAIGGATEVLSTTPSTYHLILNKRKGFARLALQTGSSLVPVFAFGQNDLFHQPRSIVPPRIDSWLSKWPKIVIKYSFLAYHDPPTHGITPRPTPIHVVVGAPIPVTKVPHPTQEQVDELQGEYIAKLTEIFETHKGTYAVDKHLRLVFDTKK